MSDTAANSNAPKRPRRRWLTFSLRTFLVGSTLASLALWGLASRIWPERIEETLPGGLIWRTRTKEPPEPRTEPIPYGEFTLLDRHGRPLASGKHTDGRASGRWLHYHANGRTAMSGEAADLASKQTWAAWDERGVKFLESNMEQGKIVIHGRNLSWPNDWHSALRGGSFSQWWPNGRLKAKGEFRKNLREGAWTFWDESGRKTAAGEYRRGLREGEWQILEPESPERKTVWYVKGRAIPDRDEQVTRLAAELKSAERDARFEIVEALGKLGAPAAPILADELTEDDIPLSLWILRALAALGSEAQAALPAITRLTSSTDQTLRREALVVCFLLDDESRVNLFRDLLLESDLADAAAARSWHLRLAALGRPTLSALAAALDDPERQVRLRALDVMLQMIYPSRTMGWYQHHEHLYEEVVPLLDKAEQDVDPEISRAAKEVRDVQRQMQAASEEFYQRSGISGTGAM